MSFNMRNFADILASRQGGVKLEPGCSITKELSGEQVKKIFGYIPSAIAAYGVIITVRPEEGGKYKITVRMED